MKDKKNQIYFALLSHVRKNGIADIKTKKLAKEAQVAEGTIFYYYKDMRGLVDEAAQRYDREMMDKAMSYIKQDKSLSEIWDIMFEDILNNPDGANFYFEYINYYGFDPTEENTRTVEFLKVAQNIFKGKDLSEHEVLILWDYVTTQLFYYCNKISNGYLERTPQNIAFIKKMVFLVCDNI